MSALGETFQDRLALRAKLTGKDLTPKETIQAYAEELCRVANDRDRLQHRLDAMIDQPAPADEQKVVKALRDHLVGYDERTGWTDEAVESCARQIVAALQGEK